MTEVATNQFCTKCKKTLAIGQFYTHKDGTKCDMCKKCQTMHIDNWNPETFVWLLKDMDVPYVADEWNVLRDRALAKNGPHKMTGMSVYGKYLSKMKLKQWQDYTFADSEKLQADRDRKTGKAIAAGKIQSPDVLKEMLDSGEISDAEFQTLSEEPILTGPPARDDYAYPLNNPGYVPVDLTIDLTEEDMQYLALKWGRLYQPSQWIVMEDLHAKMHDSFDIQSAAREDTLKHICKISMKMAEAIDCGDIEGFNKLSRPYEVLMKSGKFTEAQNKDDKNGVIDSIGELVGICETEGGFIPRFKTEFPQDIVDKTIQDMNRYTFNLVTKEMGLGQLIEDHLKKIQQQQEMEDAEELNDGTDLDDIERTVLDDVQMEEFYDHIEGERAIDLAGEPEAEEDDA